MRLEVSTEDVERFNGVLTLSESQRQINDYFKVTRSTSIAVWPRPSSTPEALTTSPKIPNQEKEVAEVGVTTPWMEKQKRTLSMLAVHPRAAGASHSNQARAPTATQEHPLTFAANGTEKAPIFVL